MKKIVFLVALFIAFFHITTEAGLINTSDSGAVRHWDLTKWNRYVDPNVVNYNTRAIRYFLASDAYSTTNTAAELKAVRNAFRKWASVSGTIVKFEDGGLAAPGVDVNDSDRTNVVFWAKQSTLVNGGNDDISGALGVTFYFYYVDDGVMYNCDIVFNGVEYDWITDPNNNNTRAYYVESVALHEIGHMLGLGHSPCGGATMFPRGVFGSTLQSELTLDDVITLRQIYPDSTLSSISGKIKGRVTSNGAPVFGAVVLLENDFGNVVYGGYTKTNGTYEFGYIPTGHYVLRVTPLDKSQNMSLLSGADVDYYTFAGAMTDFLPSSSDSVFINPNSTTELNVAVTNVAPLFRIARVIRPTTNSSWSAINAPVSVKPGQKNIKLGVIANNINSRDLALTVTGNDIDLLATDLEKNIFGDSVYDLVMITVNVRANARPGLRSFCLSNSEGAAWANGFIKIENVSRLSPPVFESNKVIINFPTDVGYSYQLWRCENLTEGKWNPVGPNLIAKDFNASVQDTNILSKQNLFYRLTRNND